MNKYDITEFITLWVRTLCKDGISSDEQVFPLSQEATIVVFCLLLIIVLAGAIALAWAASRLLRAVPRLSVSILMRFLKSITRIYNRSSWVSGNLDRASDQARLAAGMTVALGIMVFYAVSVFWREGLSLSDPLVISLFLGLPLVVPNWIIFVRRRTRINTARRLLAPWRRY